MSIEPRETLPRAYDLMRKHYGHQHWWPGDTAFEVCMGAILTQNTNWGNVERAITNLKAADRLEPRRLYALKENELAQLIRPAGYYNIKARRIRFFLTELVERYAGDLAQLFRGPIVLVKQRLLAIKGIGPETADSMLLYAGQKASFVIDAYTKRIFLRHRWCREESTYDDLQALCQDVLRHRQEQELLDYWQDFHAQLVNIGKDFCRKTKPRCEICPLRPLLKTTPIQDT